MERLDLNLSNMPYSFFCKNLFYQYNNRIPDYLTGTIVNENKSFEDIIEEVTKELNDLSDKLSKNSYRFIERIKIYEDAYLAFRQKDSDDCVPYDSCPDMALGEDVKNIMPFSLHNRNVKEGDKLIDFVYMVIEKSNGANTVLMIRINEFHIAYDSTCEIDNKLVNLLRDYYTKLHIPQAVYNKIFLINKTQYGYTLIPSKIKNLENFDVAKQYNDDFVNIDKKINEFINLKTKSGLVILHGLQGTGKTTYIRNLINTHNKQFIYLPNELANYLSDPTFISFITEQGKNSIIILEDCENLLRDRKINQSINDGLVNILNMSDGLLGDNLNLKFICTFNSDYESIDKALTRKGRLICKYEFNELSLDKTNELLKSVYGEDVTSDKPLSLAEIYNFEDDNNANNQENKIGF